MLLLDVLFVIFLLAMLVQGLLSLFFNLYVWESPERIEDTASPTEYIAPKHTYTVLLPAKNEEAVIARTIANIAASNYPKDMIEIFVICEASDKGTIDAAKQAIVDGHFGNAGVITFRSKPVNKPHGLNIGLKYATKEIVVIFDAEDDTNPDIFNIANTLYETKNADVIQAGVQLMNYDTTWFSSHNVLEYFFWFKSRMHYQTKVGVTPLGGNTVFFKTAQLRNVGGWNEECLTEDAEIGIRLSVAGAKVISTYDPRHVTKEETPDTVGAFIKQRTRWNQGFIQVLKYGHWKEYDTTFKKIFCFYTLFFPIVQGILFVLTPLALWIGFNSKMSILISLLSFLPVLLVLLQLAVFVVGLHEFVREQNLKAKYHVYLLMILTLIPYQIMLGIGAIRATTRELRGVNNWEKTAHTGLHRSEPLTLEKI
jgi:cellulose synthase/poly-beta-1,6-N-acetylglucosamine synthase-like glycosyltransferase